MITIWDN